MDKIEALAKGLGVDENEIDEGRNNTFTVNNEEYLVLTEDEADEAAKESIQNLIDAMGFESFSPDFQSHIIDWHLEESFFQEYMDDSNRSYAEGIESESSSTFQNRLIEECYNSGIITDDDFEQDGDEPDYYACTLDTDELIDKYVDSKSNEDPVEWYRSTFGDTELSDILKSNPNIVDWDSVIDDSIEQDGRGNTLASYDGIELELANEDGYIEYYAYRTE